MAGICVVVGFVPAHSGPWHKLHAWANGFTRNGITTSILTQEPTISGVRTIRQRLAGTIDQESSSSPQMIFIRSHWSVPLLLPILCKARRRGWVVAVDVPTAVGAARQEITSSDRRLWAKATRLLVEWVWTPAGWFAADLVVQTCNDVAPWAWLTRRRRITITNGAVNPSDELAEGWQRSGRLRFLAVGTVAHWHGLDRLVHALSISPREASLAIVGDGPEITRLRSLVARLRLQQRVSFAGALRGTALEDAYRNADVAVGSIGEHRRGRFTLSPLKTRDYLWRGLPVIYSGDDPDLDDTPFVLRLPDDDSPVDIDAVAAWLAYLRQGSTTAQDIHEFAQQRFDYAARAASVWKFATAADRPL